MTGKRSVNASDLQTLREVPFEWVTANDRIKGEVIVDYKTALEIPDLFYAIERPRAEEKKERKAPFKNGKLVDSLRIYQNGSTSSLLFQVKRDLTLQNIP